MRDRDSMMLSRICHPACEDTNETDTHLANNMEDCHEENEAYAQADDHQLQFTAQVSRKEAVPAMKFLAAGYSAAKEAQLEAM